MTQSKKAHALGFNHIALEVGDVEEAGVKILPGPFLDFYDPWGNRVEIVGYQGIQFSKAPNVLRGMGMAPE
jgi:hypothetical protein